MTNLSNSSQEWKSIPDYEGLYNINSKSVIVNLISKKILRQSLTVRGYVKVTLRKDGYNKSYEVHRLLAKAFIPNPNNFPVVNHINEIKNDNRLENLEWCTVLHNTKEWHKNNCKKKKKINTAKLNEMFHMSKIMPIKDIASKFNIPTTSLSVLLNYMHPDY